MSDLTVHRANGDAHKIVQKYLPASPHTIEIGSVVTIDGGQPAMRTEIHWRGPITPEHVQMGAAITELSGYVRAENDDRHITYWRTA